MVFRQRNRLFFLLVLLLLFASGGYIMAEGQAEQELHRIMNKDDNSSQPSIAQQIVPGEGIGLFHLNLTKDDLLLRLGDPDAVYNSLNKALSDLKENEEYYLYKSLGLAFILKNDDMQKIVTFSPQYKLESGIGVGSSRDKVEELFTAAFTLSKSADRDILYYMNTGVAFSFRKDQRTVWEIIIFKKGV